MTHLIQWFVETISKTDALQIGHVPGTNGPAGYGDLENPLEYSLAPRGRGIRPHPALLERAATED